MAEARVLLRYLNGLTGDSGAYPIPDATSEQPAVTHVFHVNGKLSLRQESNATKSADDVVARLQVSFPNQFVLEPRIEEVTIEPPPNPKYDWLKSDGPISFPASTDQEHWHIVLRPGDTINFTEQPFKIQFDIEPVDMASEIPAIASATGAINGTHASSEDESFTNGGADADASGSDIQIKSSHQQLEQPEVEVEHDEPASDSETDDEDLDATSTGWTTKTPAQYQNATPATSHHTIGEIKETPARPSTRDENLPFSTAPESAEDDGEEIRVTSSAAVHAIDVSSPLAKKTHDSQENKSKASRPADSQTQPNALVDEVELTPPSEDRTSSDNRAASEELGTIFDNEPSTSGRKQRKYGKKGGVKAKKNAPKRAAAVKSRKTSTVNDTDADDVENDEKIDVAARTDRMEVDEEPDDDDPAVLTTSEPLDEHDVATESAKRSIRPQSSKRSLPKAFQGDDNESAPTQRKRARKESPTSETLSPSKDDDSETPQASAKNTRSGKLNTVTRRETEGEEIAVAPPSSNTRKAKGGAKAKVVSSPQVRIPAKLPSETPESTATSAMGGKAPKLLFSHSDVGNGKGMQTWLKQKGSAIVEDVPTKRVHFLCVVPKGPLATTAKILRTLALGKQVVIDDWVTDSKEWGQLLEPDDYAHETIEAKDRSSLFKGYVLYFTKKLELDYGTKGWNSIQALCREAGANLVESGSASHGHNMTPMGKVIFFGSETDDSDVAPLMSEHKYVVYHKDMLTQSVLKGELDLDDDEFKLLMPADPASPAKRTRKH